MLRIRLLPIMILFALVMLGMKLVDVMQGTGYFQEWFGLRILKAETAQPAATPPAAAPPSIDPSPADPAAAATTALKPGDLEEQSKRMEPHINPHDPKSVPLDPLGGTDILHPANHIYSAVEIELLQQLTTRRHTLDLREKALTDRDNILQATSNKVEKRIEELKTLQDKVQQLLEQYNAKEDMKIQSLVKIYENMKPRDAAKIFNELEMPILLQVVDKMKQAKAAPILAQMDPIKAKDLTTQLADETKLLPPPCLPTQ